MTFNEYRAICVWWNAIRMFIFSIFSHRLGISTKNEEFCIRLFNGEYIIIGGTKKKVDERFWKIVEPSLLSVTIIVQSISEALDQWHGIIINGGSNCCACFVIIEKKHNDSVFLLLVMAPTGTQRRSPINGYFTHLRQRGNVMRFNFWIYDKDLCWSDDSLSRQIYPFSSDTCPVFACTRQTRTTALHTLRSVYIWKHKFVRKQKQQVLFFDTILSSGSVCTHNLSLREK